MAATVRALNFDRWLGPSVQDAYEETFLLFSESLPSHNLGFIDSKAGQIELDISGRTFTLRQSPSLLTSQRATGTTGAVLWKITPLVAEWLSSKPAILRDAGILVGGTNIVELGCGITGLIGLVVAPQAKNYILTDQSYVMKTLHQNIEANAQPLKATKNRVQVPANLPKAVPLDWETDAPSLRGLSLEPGQAIDLIVVCDCVYNEHLIKPLIATLVEICQLNNQEAQAGVLVAQQLRSETIFEQFLSALLETFDVWRLTDGFLNSELRSGSGYVLHLAVLRTPKGQDS